MPVCNHLYCSRDCSEEFDRYERYTSRVWVVAVHLHPKGKTKWNYRELIRHDIPPQRKSNIQARINDLICESIVICNCCCYSLIRHWKTNFHLHRPRLRHGFLKRYCFVVVYYYDVIYINIIEWQNLVNKLKWLKSINILTTTCDDINSENNPFWVMIDLNV
jgi:hypothetical protein